MGKIDYTGITNEQHTAINDVIDELEFDKIRHYMNSINWKWSIGPKDEDGIRSMAIPEIHDLKEGLRSMLVRCFQSVNLVKEEDPDYKGPCWSSCGGFTVFCWPDNRCQAFFSVTDWWHDPEDFKTED
jgi:hypothetical protein